MSFRRADASLRDLMPALVEALPLVQQRLDAEYLDQLAALRDLAVALPPEHRALIPAPWRQVLSETTVEAELRFSASRGAELGVELLPLAYRRRYAYSGFTSGKVALTVRQVPPVTPEEEE